MTTTVETAKGWTEWLDFMVKVHGYGAWDVRLVKQFEFLQDFLGRLPRGARVLDVGAGQCEMRRFFEGFRYVGADAAWGDVAWDYSKLDVVTNVQQIPFRTGTFDGAINIWVAEHVRDPVGMVGEIARVLKPGGWFMAFVPFVVHEHQTPHDYYRFTRFGAAALLEDNGFEEIQVLPDSSLGFAVSYEGVKHLNTLRNAAGLPPEWKTQLQGATEILTKLAQHFAQDRQFPAEAPALSFLALGRKPVQARAVRERARPAGPSPQPVKRRLNVGCGNQKKPGWIGIDKVKTPATNLVRDLARGLPFEDSSVDEIYCDNVLEHIGPPEDFIFVLNEFHRVLKPGSVATIIVPDARSQGAWQDPTHVRAFVPRSALYWNQDLPWPKLYGITANFDVQVEEYGDRQTEGFLRFTCRKKRSY